jgi:hypothetical protein
VLQQGAYRHTKKEGIKLKNVHSREAVYTAVRLFDVLWLKQRSAGPCTAEFSVPRKLYTHSFVGLFYVVLGSLEYLENPILTRMEPVDSYEMLS